MIGEGLRTAHQQIIGEPSDSVNETNACAYSVQATFHSG
jgi:hypothetical protein